MSKRRKESPNSEIYLGLGSLETIVENLEEANGFRKDTGSEKESVSSLTELDKPVFNPCNVQLLDISNIFDAVKSVFFTGSLPAWLGNFHSLQILKAPKCGLLVVDPWILQLTQLREVYLEHNLISTWPHFLESLPELKYICLDGNPCLEKAFCKSPTLRSLYFNWGLSKDSYKSVPQYVRGPEWPPAATARAGMSLNLGGFACYFGGIYTLSTPPDSSNDGYLTPVEPCPLQSRLSRKPHSIPISPSRPTSSASDISQHQPPDSRITRQSKTLLNIFRDIDQLLRRNDEMTIEQSRKIYVPVTGDFDIGFTTTDIAYHNASKRLDIYGILWDLAKEEEQYCSELRKVIKEFFSSRISSSTVISSLNTIFEWFPTICSSHHKGVYPALLSLTSAVGTQWSSSLEKEVDALSRALVQVQNAYEWYARRLNISECFLDIPSCSSGLYRDEELQEHVRKQVMKLGGINGYFTIQFPNGNGSNSMDILSRRKSSDMFKSKKEEGPVAQWAAKTLNKPHPYIEKHPREYIFLPLVHIVRYERVFTVLSHLDSRFDPIKTACREIRRHVAYRRRTSLIHARTKLLVSKFRVSESNFKEYRWDVILSVLSRSYLEKGFLEPKTVDVFDTAWGEPASFVKEVFNDSFQRLIRLVCCDDWVQLWDEAFESIIGTIHKSDMKVQLIGDKCLARVLFKSVRELCLVSVKEFSAPYATTKSDAEEFEEACKYDKYMF